MVSLAIGTALVGAALGWGRVATFFVATCAILGVVAGLGTALAGLWWMALGFFVVSFCFQLGFASGSAIETYLAYLSKHRAFLVPRRETV
jgi:hypothetical protein